MTILLATIPISILLGALGLAAFLWALRSGQYRDLDGDAARILFSDEEEAPEADESRRREEAGR
jgi:cbb3-type cytochrome oxidase maturation protein